jgi:hypothetical protein
VNYDEAIAIVRQTRDTYDLAAYHEPGRQWPGEYVGTLLQAAETLRDKAKEAEGVAAMLEKALKARGATTIPSRTGDRVILLLEMAEMAMQLLVVKAGLKGFEAETLAWWRRVAYDVELLTNKSKVPGEGEAT